MRTAEEMLALILQKAEAEERIRGVLLNGSRANSEVQPDQFQDFDIIYLVTDLSSFIKDHRWVHYFGKQLIMQLPDTSTLFPSKKTSFAYLMQFEDGNRIDLTLMTVTDYQKQETKDSLTKVLLDKDNLLGDIAEANPQDYYVKKPTEHEFQDCINEFWWVATYVAKGLVREEITYAKAMHDGPVRDMLMLALDWKVGLQYDFHVNTGKNGKFLQRYLSSVEWKALMGTYADSQIATTWQALFTMCDFFEAITDFIGTKLSYSSGTNASVVKAYLQSLKK